MIRHFRLHSTHGKRTLREFLSKQMTASALCFLKEWPGGEMFAHLPCHSFPRPPSSSSRAAFTASRWLMRRSREIRPVLEQDSLPGQRFLEAFTPSREVLNILFLSYKQHDLKKTTKKKTPKKTQPFNIGLSSAIIIFIFRKYN